MGRPELHPDEIRIIARQFREHVCRPRIFPNPLQYVVSLGLRPLELRIPGYSCEITDGKIIAYPPCADQRKQGLFVYHGLAHYLAGQQCTEADVWLLTGELVYPTPIARVTNTIIEATAAQQWAPAWFLVCQIARVDKIDKAA